jgi:hypothetical protein
MDNLCILLIRMIRSKCIFEACSVCGRCQVCVQKFVESHTGTGHVKENLQCSCVTNINTGLLLKWPVDLTPSLKFLHIIFLKTAFVSVCSFDISGVSGYAHFCRLDQRCCGATLFW